MTGLFGILNILICKLANCEMIATDYLHKNKNQCPRAKWTAMNSIQKFSVISLYSMLRY